MEKSYPHLLTRQEGHLFWVTLNNPQKKNAITLEMIESLTTQLKLADQASDIRVIILKGAGDCFCAGGDIKSMQEQSGMFAGESNELRERYRFGIQQIPLTIESLQTPLVAMVNGAAVGAGCDLACMCDLRVGSEKALFYESFSRIGLVPGDGGSYFLSRVVGHARAMEMFLATKKVFAQEALNWGLLNELVDADELENKTTELAIRIADNSPAAVQMTKRAVLAAARQDLVTHLDLLAAYQAIGQRMEDHFEGLEALLGKRRPHFKAR